MTQGATDELGEKILDAAVRTLLNFGFRRTSIEMICREAGLSHMTLYRRWPRRDDLILAAAIREIRTVFDQADLHMAAHEHMKDKLVEGFASIYWQIVNHPLLVRELTSDPATVLPLMTIHGHPALEIATTYLAAHIQDWVGAKSLTNEHREIAEVAVRLLQSLLLTPSPQITTEADARSYARSTLLPIAAERIEKACRT